MENLHPRPQFVRKDWKSLDGEWLFAFDDERNGEEKGWKDGIEHKHTIQVPFTYETQKSGIFDTSHHSVVWYERTIEVTEDKNVLLHFEGVDYHTTLWVNGLFAGTHEGGYHAFEFDITKWVQQGENKIVLRVEDSLDCTQPRGKQRWLQDNFGCWYVQTTGIWKSVWMEYVSPLRIDYVKMTPEYDKQEIVLEVDINQFETTGHLTFKAEISFAGEMINTVTASVLSGFAKLSASVVKNGEPWNMKRWSHHEPNLYDIKFELYQDNQLIDEVTSYFGMRKIEIKGQKIILNNEPLYQRLILDQGYWKESDLTPPSVQALEDDIDFMLKMGYNGVRKHQKIEDNRFLYLCDKKGLLVWSEFPSTYSFHDRALERVTTEWMKIVKQNYNHPSIITWVPFNESWGVNDIRVNTKQQQFTESIYYLTKAFDNMRPVVTNDGWEHTISDILTLHDYEELGSVVAKRYANEERLLSNEIPHDGNRYPFADGYHYKGQPVIISEFGGIAFRNESGWGYGNQVDSMEAFMDRFEKIHHAFQDLEYISGFCYTQLTDVQQEVNGLLTEDRQPKVDLEEIRKINTRRLK